MQLIYGKFFGIICAVMDMNKEILDKALALLENVTPLRTDCGLLCGNACCKDNGDAGSAVWLLPGEEETDYPWAEVTETVTPVTGTLLRQIYCKGFCAREKRPFLCRIFPLSPHFSIKKGVWSVRMDRRAAALCPLFICGGIKGLDPVFTETCREAIRLIAANPEGEQILKILELEEDAFRFEL